MEWDIEGLMVNGGRFFTREEARGFLRTPDGIAYLRAITLYLRHFVPAFQRSERDGVIAGCLQGCCMIWLGDLAQARERFSLELQALEWADE